MARSILRSKGGAQMTDLTVVIPVYKEDPKIVTNLYKKLLTLGCEVIVVNDGDTVNLDFKHIDYYPQMGYGFALKKGIKAATTPLVLTMDGDNQHCVEDVVKLYQVHKMIKDCRMVIGCRWDLREKFIRRMGRKCLNFLASVLVGHYLVDLNSGMRIFERKLAVAYEPILCDVFSFTTSLTMSFLGDKHKMVWLPIEVRPRAHGKSHVNVVTDGFITLWYILKIGLALRTRGIRSWIRRS